MKENAAWVLFYTQNIQGELDKADAKSEAKKKKIADKVLEQMWVAMTTKKKNYWISKANKSIEDQEEYEEVTVSSKKTTKSVAEKKTTKKEASKSPEKSPVKGNKKQKVK